MIEVRKASATGQSLPTQPPFGERLQGAIEKFGPLCVGIDPHPALLKDWGLEVSPEGLQRFCDICVEAFDSVAAVKPQVAFFEAFGSRGYNVLENVIASLRSRGTLVISDAKRGDIGSTVAAYAEAWLGNSTLASDAVTVSPFLGFESLRPVLDLAERNARGVFVLAATSNPEGKTLQSATVDGNTVSQSIVDRAASENTDCPSQLGSVGVVVGATIADVPNLSGLKGPVLVPGLGAQGGRSEDIKGLGGAMPGQLLPAVSREILQAGPKVAELREAVDKFLATVSYLA